MLNRPLAPRPLTEKRIVLPGSWRAVSLPARTAEEKTAGIFPALLALLDHGPPTDGGCASNETAASNPARRSGATGDPNVRGVRPVIEAVVADWVRPPRLIRRDLLAGHRRLMRGLHGSGQLRQPGHCHVRCRQTGAVIYTPPDAERLPALMDNLMRFANGEGLPCLASAFVVMLQLLLIHPFADGNGRCARALFAALCLRGGMSHPIVLLALARLYGRGGTRLHAGSAVLRATGDWHVYLDYARLSIEDAQRMWNEHTTSHAQGEAEAFAAARRLWERALVA